MGFFRPDMADQALSCMKMMEFTGKEAVMKRIGENGTLYQQVMMLQQQLAMLTGGMAGAGGPAAGAQPPGMISASRGIGGEHPTVQNARERAGEAASPG